MHVLYVVTHISDYLTAFGAGYPRYQYLPERFVKVSFVGQINAKISDSSIFSSGPFLWRA